MKKFIRVIFGFMLFVSLASADEQKSELRMIVELIKLNQETMNKRFEDMQKNMDKRFEQVDKRFEDMQKNMDKRFDNIFIFLSFITTIILAAIAYLIKDRKVVDIMAKDLKVEVERIDNSLKQKADKKIVEKLIEIIERLAKNNKDVQEMLKKHNLSYQG
jgi:hypothetical protein